MEDPIELVVILLPADQLRFAESCTGSRDISRAVSSGLDLLAERLWVMQGCNAFIQSEDSEDSMRNH